MTADKLLAKFGKREVLKLSTVLCALLAGACTRKYTRSGLLALAPSTETTVLLSGKNEARVLVKSSVSLSVKFDVVRPANCTAAMTNTVLFGGLSFKDTISAVGKDTRVTLSYNPVMKDWFFKVEIKTPLTTTLDTAALLAVRFSLAALSWNEIVVVLSRALTHSRFVVEVASRATISNRAEQMRSIAQDRSELAVAATLSYVDILTQLLVFKQAI